MMNTLRRFLLACLGMVLLGTAGLLILHRTVDAPGALVGSGREIVAIENNHVAAFQRRPDHVGHVLMPILKKKL